MRKGVYYVDINFNTALCDTGVLGIVWRMRWVFAMINDIYLHC